MPAVQSDTGMKNPILIILSFLMASSSITASSRPFSFQQSELIIASRSMPAGAVATIDIELAAADTIVAFFADIRIDTLGLELVEARPAQLEAGDIQMNAGAGFIKLAGATLKTNPIAAPGDVITIASIDIRATGAPGDTLELIPWALRVGEGAPEMSPGDIAEIIIIEALPVELVDFWGSLDGDVVRLSWQTTSETNSDRFDVVRLSDHDPSQAFVGTLPGAGDHEGLTHYELADTLETPGRFHYLLRQFDRDGWFTTYGPVTVEHIQLEPAIISAPFPNPTAGSVAIVAGFSRSEFTTIDLIDIIGRRRAQLWAGYVQAQAPVRFEFQIDEGSGVYFVRIAGGFGERVFPITVIR